MKVKQEIDRLVSLLQAMTLQRINAIREGRQAEAVQIQSVQVDIDNKIQELELLIYTEQAINA
jgi:hypothetical protein